MVGFIADGRHDVLLLVKSEGASKQRLATELFGPPGLRPVKVPPRRIGSARELIDRDKKPVRVPGFDFQRKQKIMTCAKEKKDDVGGTTTQAATN